ncbi:hypothetical protein ACJX0J_022317 [Zea mays]
MARFTLHGRGISLIISTVTLTLTFLLFFYFSLWFTYINFKCSIHTVMGWSYVVETPQLCIVVIIMRGVFYSIFVEYGTLIVVACSTSELLKHHIISPLCT